MNEKKIFLYLYLFIAVSVVFSLLIAFNVHRTHSVLGEIKYDISSDSSVQFYIDEVNTNFHRRIYVKGWAIVKGQEFKFNKTKIIFEDLENSKKFIIPTYSVSRADVYQHINKKNEVYERFNNCGFVAAAERSELATNGRYQILILFDNGITRDLVSTNKTVEL